MYVGSARSDPFARIDAFISPSETVDELQSYFSGKTASLDGSKNLWLVTRIVGRDEDNEESWPVDRQKFARDVAWACQRVSQILTVPPEGESKLFIIFLLAKRHQVGGF